MIDRAYLYANLADEDVKIIDEISKELGYTSRTEMVTEILQSLLYGKAFRKETTELNALLTLAPELERLRQTFMDIIDEYAFPIVAMRGADAAYNLLQDDLKRWMFERCNAVPAEQDMKEWLRLYAAIKKGEIQRYRIQQITEQYKEEQGVES